MTDACKNHKPRWKCHNQPSKSGDTLPHPNADRVRGMQQLITKTKKIIINKNNPYVIAN
jgi:hypothetical protein